MSVLAAVRPLQRIHDKLLVQGGRRCSRGVKMLPARTINPAEPRTCERPRQVQLLVNAVRISCPHNDPISPTSARITRVVPVRVCTRRDLERMCRPKLCSCPQKRLPLTSRELARCIAMYGLKALIAGGIFYWTKAEGIWGDAEDSENFYLRFREAWDTCYDENVQVPHLEVLKFKIVDSYNRVILAVMGVLVGVPMRLSRALRDYLYPCKKVEEKVIKKLTWPPKCD